MVREDFSLQLLPCKIKACLSKELVEPPMRQLYRKMREGNLPKSATQQPCILKKIKQ
jgi:hypothetical protein